MLKIRLQRVGRKNHAAFRVVVSEHARAAKKANIVEALGSYDPHGSVAIFKEERIRHWLTQGAQASETVHNLLVKKGIISGKKKAVFKVRPPKVKEEAPASEAESAVAEAGAAAAPEEVPAAELAAEHAAPEAEPKAE